MSNKAKNDKGSILVDVENLLDAFEPAFMLMPKIKRLHGAAVRMEDAAYDLIDHYSIAYYPMAHGRLWTQSGLFR